MVLDSNDDFIRTLKQPIKQKISYLNVIERKNQVQVPIPEILIEFGLQHNFFTFGLHIRVDRVKFYTVFENRKTVKIRK